MTNESLSTKSQETTESVTINDKTKPHPSTEAPPSTTNTAAPTPPQEEVKQKINIENDILMGLCRKRDLGQLSQSDHKESASREATLRKYKANLKQKEAARRRQKKFCVNQKRKIETIEKQIGPKLSKKSQEEGKHVDNEELTVPI